ncbi:MFS transporter [Streptomyces palmae]|uniref:MFS transporter n=1 Tax=Streptomyces palmae TaxID=1701085 RepID=A0A4Z0GTT7_9ACTN|nr:MFS transporter [Streptomyces palmae]TGB00971.1 MFS transporter [Streptomyces palmae]
MTTPPPQPAPPTRVLRLARLSTFAFFTLNGLLMGAWVVHIPAIEDRLQISHAVLGWLLLFLGGGAFLGMQVCGPLTDRYGSHRLVPVGGVLCSASLALPGLAHSAWTLALALLVLGFANGCLDVSMNTHAVQVERGYRRPVMSAFHAFFSIGGVLAALLGARTLSWGWSVPATLTGAAAAGIVLTLIAARGLLRPDPATGGPAPTGTAENDPPAHPGKAADPGRGTPSRVWALAVLALLVMLCEGVANDWSVLHLRDALDAPAATAAFAYGGFATAMTAGRLATDPVVARIGPVRVVRYGTVLAAAGLATASLTPWIPLALIGWTAFGLGLSGAVPQFFSAAGHLDPEASGAYVSRVAGLGYLGVLAGPAVIGPLTHLVPLQATFLLPVAFCLVAACAAGVLAPARASGPA